MSQRKWIYSAAGAATLLLAGIATYLALEPRTFCEAVADGASLDELTRHMKKYDPTKLQKDGWGAYFVHTSTKPYGCAYTVEGGRVVSVDSN